jgi:mitogen-activated protein kinase 1/3
LGKGAYGYVCAVKNAETGERLAVKKVKKAFEDLVDAKLVLREISEIFWCLLIFFLREC